MIPRRIAIGLVLVTITAGLARAEIIRVDGGRMYNGTDFMGFGVEATRTNCACGGNSARDKARANVFRSAGAIRLHNLAGKEALP